MGGHLDYFKHTYYDALDWHRNEVPLREAGYSTDLIAHEAASLILEHDVKQPLFLYVSFNAPHAPQQVPDEYVRPYEHLQNKKRGTYAGMVACMDKAIGHVLDAIDKRGMQENTLVVFFSDNGGATNTAANNLPLRGHKGQLYEGGVRVPAAMVWPGVIRPNVVVNEPLHIVDLYPTLIGLAGGVLEQPLPIDGRNAWPTISQGTPMTDREILLNVHNSDGAIRQGGWKLVRNGVRSAKPPVIELFNIVDDPNEMQNVAQNHPQKVKQLCYRLDEFSQQEIAPDGLEPNEPEGFQAPKVWDYSDLSKEDMVWEHDEIQVN